MPAPPKPPQECRPRASARRSSSSREPPRTRRCRLPPSAAAPTALGGAAMGLGPDVAAGIDNPAARPGPELRVRALRRVSSRGRAATSSPRSASSPATTRSRLASGLQPQSYADVVQALHTLADPGNGIRRKRRASASRSRTEAGSSRSRTGATAVSSARVDLVHTALGANPATSIAFNDSAAVFRGLELKDLALAKSMSFFLGRLTVGAAVHALWGTTYTKEESVFTVDVSDPWSLAQRALTGTARSHTDWSVRPGALVSLGPCTSAGSGEESTSRRSRTRRTAPAADRGRSVTYGQQARVGASVQIPVVGPPRRGRLRPHGERHARAGPARAADRRRRRVGRSLLVVGARGRLGEPRVPRPLAGLHGRRGRRHRSREGRSRRVVPHGPERARRLAAPPASASDAMLRFELLVGPTRAARGAGA